MKFIYVYLAIIVTSNQIYPNPKNSVYKHSIFKHNAIYIYTKLFLWTKCQKILKDFVLNNNNRKKLHFMLVIKPLEKKVNIYT